MNGSPRAEIARVVAAIDELAAADHEDDDGTHPNGNGSVASQAVPAVSRTPAVTPVAGHNLELVSPDEAKLIDALKEGLSAEKEVFLRVRDLLGSQRLTQKLRRTLHEALSDLARRKLVAIEDGEYFLLPAGRVAIEIGEYLQLSARRKATLAARTAAKATGRRRYRRRWSMR